MQRTFIGIFLLLCGMTLLAFIGTLLSAPEARLVLSRFNPTLDEPILEDPLIAPRNVEPGVYHVASSEAIFTITHPSEARNAYVGTTTLTTGTLTLTQSKFGEWNGTSTFVIDMSAINFLRDNDAFDLHTADFFATETYPQAILIITNIGRQGDSNVFDLTGRLTLRGETHDVTIPTATIYVRDDTLVLETDFMFDRTQWGITHASPSFSGTRGDTMLSDNVNVVVTTTFPLTALE